MISSYAKVPEWLSKSRIHIGQIISIDEQNGRATVRLATSDEEWTPQIPLGGYSIQGINSSWIRYMPQVYDFVKVGFGPDGLPELLSYAAFGDEPDATDAGVTAGRAPVARQGAYATAARLAAAGSGGLGSTFRTLRQGEWQLRSRGGAEVLGTQNGTLSLAAGGGASMRLLKDRQEERHRAQLVAFDNNGASMRLGIVKRKLLPTDPNESVPTLPNAGAPLGGSSGISSTLREYSVELGFPTPPVGTPKLKYWDSTVGAVTDSFGIPELFIPSAQSAAQTLGATSAAPLRARQRFYATDGIIPQATLQIDSQGNVQLDMLATAAPIGLATAAVRQYHWAATAATLASPVSVFLGSEGALQSAVVGATGIPQSFVLGTSWAAARAVMNSVKIAQHAQLSGADAAIAAAAATLATATTTALTSSPPIDPRLDQVAAALIAFATATATAAGLSTAAQAQLATAITTFETGPGTPYISTKVFGE